MDSDPRRPLKISVTIALKNLDDVSIVRHKQFRTQGHAHNSIPAGKFESSFTFHLLLDYLERQI
jgi:hypothetical protein